jgi:hypothetical protein
MKSQISSEYSSPRQAWVDEADQATLAKLKTKALEPRNGGPGGPGGPKSWGYPQIIQSSWMTMTQYMYRLIHDD